MSKDKEESRNIPPAQDLNKENVSSLFLIFNHNQQGLILARWSQS